MTGPIILVTEFLKSDQVRSGEVILNWILIALLFVLLDVFVFKGKLSKFIIDLFSALGMAVIFGGVASWFFNRGRH